MTTPAYADTIIMDDCPVMSEEDERELAEWIKTQQTKQELVEARRTIDTLTHWRERWERVIQVVRVACDDGHLSLYLTGLVRTAEAGEVES